MSLSIPYTFIGGPGNKARAAEVNANFLAVASKFTEGVGGISDADCSIAMGLKGSKLSNVPGNRVPTDRIEDDAIDKNKLRDDATAGAPNAAVNTAEHIKDRIVTGSKVVIRTLSRAELKATVSSYVMSGVLTSSGAYLLGSGFTPAIPNGSTAQILSVWVESALPMKPIVALPVLDLGDNSNRVFIHDPTGPDSIAGFTMKALWIELA